MRREDMPTIQVRRWTREEYDRMIEAGVLSPEDHIELIDGEILQVTPQGARHATAVCMVHKALTQVAPRNSIIRIQMPLAIGPRSAPEPDIAVVRGGLMDYSEEHPASAILIVEVSEAAIAFDRDRKGSMYARAGIPEYWLINLPEQCLEVYREPEEIGGADNAWAYAKVERLEEWQSVSPLFAPTAAIPISDLIPRKASI